MDHINEVAPSPAVRATRRDDVLLLTIDNPPVNASSAAVRREIIFHLDEFESDDGLVGAVLIGAHGTFISGSDIREFSGPVPEPLLPAVIATIEQCSKPVVAALDGFALGGGLELALGCDARIATPRCHIGLPEVTLGMVPGAGGTQRLPRLVGKKAAMELIVTGRRINASEARELGVIDEVVSPDALLEHAVARAHAGHKRLVAQEAVKDEPSEELDVMVAQMLQVGQHRPQVHAAIRLVQKAGKEPVQTSLTEERRVFDRLRSSDEAAALRHVFFAERAADKVQIPKGTTLPKIQRIGIIGAGRMGVNIGISFSSHGYETTFVDNNPDAVAEGLTRAQREIERQMDRGHLSSSAGASAIGLLKGSTAIEDISSCDLVVEAVFEELQTKRDVLAEAERVTGRRTVIATNTSYLDLELLADGMQNPARFVGLHFFNPAHKMKLVEVVRGRHTDDVVMASTVRLIRSIKKQPLLTGVGEGFIGNRVVAAYRQQMEYLLEEGALPDQVDSAMVRFGFPMGPFAVADMSGLEIAWAMRRWQRERGTSPTRYVHIPDQLCEAGRLGRKSGKGYYAYPKGEDGPVTEPEVTSLILQESARKGIVRRDIPDEEILDRALYAIVNEGCLALKEGVALHPGDIDVALIHGFGFPRHEGGPMYWASKQSPERLQRGLKRLATATGSSFRRGPVESVLETMRTDA